MGDYKYLLIWGNGFIGMNIINYLLNKGKKVYCIDTWLKLKIFKIKIWKLNQRPISPFMVRESFDGIHFKILFFEVYL